MAKKKATPKVAPPKEEVPVKTVSFDVWFAMREKKIPSNHLNEILLADFKGRGLSKRETVEAFDEALAKYGIKL